MKRKRFLHYLLLGGAFFLKPFRLLAFSTRARNRFLNKVKFLWAGGITSTAVHVRAKLTSATGSVRLVIGKDPQLSSPVYGPFGAADAATNYVAGLTVSGLQPNTEYYYGIEADGTIDTATEAMGRFKTASAGPHSFRFSVASCNYNGNHPVFYRIKEKDPLFHVTHGDFHYGDPNSATDINVHRSPLESTILQPALKEFLRYVAMAYVWDDHDYCGDNTTAAAAGRKNARLAYQEYVPHFPLPAGSGDVPIYQSFTVGRVLFLLTDLRSEKGPSGTTMMGAAQKAWFKAECLQAKANNHVIIWINSTPWGGTTETDSWAGYAAERTELADFFKSTGIQNLLIVCGDIHMIALDDGSNYDFSTGANNPFKYPLLQAAAVNQSGSYRGGTYSHGYFLNPSRQHGQYASLDIADDGGAIIAITITGYRVDGTGAESVLLTHTINFPVFSTLPLHITHFSVVEGQEDAVTLRWETETDAAGRYKMVVERSSDGLVFSAIYSIDGHSAAGTTGRYSFTDKSPLDGKAYYRVKLIGRNNGVIYSPVRSIDGASVFSVAILNNPATRQLRVRIGAPAAEAASYTLVNSAGQPIKTAKLVLAKGQNSISIDLEGLPAGFYVFRLQTQKGQVSKRFMRQ